MMKESSDGHKRLQPKYNADRLPEDYRIRYLKNINMHPYKRHHKSFVREHKHIEQRWKNNDLSKWSRFKTQSNKIAQQISWY